MDKITVESLLAEANVLYRYGITRVENHHACQDIVQDVMLAGWNRRESFNGASSLRTWLIGIMRYKIIDHHRHASRSPVDLAKKEADSEEHDLFDRNGTWKMDPRYNLESLDDSPGTHCDRSDIMSRLEACMSKLPERLRLLFTLREIDDLDVASAAAAAGVTRGSAAVLLTRTRQRLRACLQQSGIDR
jgi:RNA polymerase sigma factor (sigma-70 family)